MTLASDCAEPRGSDASSEFACVALPPTPHFICSPSLFPLITGMWSYLSAHASLLPLWIFISQRAAQLIRSECWMFQSSGSFFFFFSPNFPCTPRHFLPGCKWWKKNTRNSPLSFPIVSLPISPSETSLPFGSPAFKFKDLSGAPPYIVFRIPPSLHLNMCGSGFATVPKRGTARKTDKDFFNPITKNSSSL